MYNTILTFDDYLDGVKVLLRAQGQTDRCSDAEVDFIFDAFHDNRSPTWARDAVCASRFVESLKLVLDDAKAVSL